MNVRMAIVVDILWIIAAVIFTVFALMGSSVLVAFLTGAWLAVSCVVLALDIADI